MRLWQWLVLFVLGAGAVACNGSGSSGFDTPHGSNTPTAAQQFENTLFLTALETQQCVEDVSQAPIVCPFAAADPLTPRPRINTDIVPHPTLVCQRLQDAESCVLPFAFTVENFAPNVIFQVAARLGDASRLWQIVPSQLHNNKLQPERLHAMVPVDLASSSHRRFVHIQVAVLAFTQPPRDVPTELEILADSNAESIFVGEFMVRVVP